MANFTLADVGVGLRNMDQRRAYEEDRAALARQRETQDQLQNAQLESIGIQRQSTQMALDQQRQAMQRSKAYEDAFKTGGGFPAVAKTAQELGDIDTYQKATAAMRAADSEGLTAVLKHQLIYGDASATDNDQQLVDIVNSYGQGRATKIERRPITDDKGNVVDVELIMHGSTGNVIKVPVNRAATVLGLTPKREWKAIGESGYAIETGTGATRQVFTKPEDASKRYIKLGDTDRLFDTQSLDFVGGGASDQLPAAVRKEIEGSVRGLFSSPFDKMDPTMRQTVLQMQRLAELFYASGGMNEFGKPISVSDATDIARQIILNDDGQTRRADPEIQQRIQQYWGRFGRSKPAAQAGRMVLAPDPNNPQAGPQWHRQRPDGKWEIPDDSELTQQQIAQRGGTVPGGANQVLPGEVNNPAAPVRGLSPPSAGGPVPPAAAAPVPAAPAAPAPAPAPTPSADVYARMPTDEVNRQFAAAKRAQIEQGTPIPPGLEEEAGKRQMVQAEREQALRELKRASPAMRATIINSLPAFKKYFTEAERQALLKGEPIDERTFTNPDEESKWFESIRGR